MRLADMPMDDKTRALWDQYQGLCYKSAMVRGEQYGVPWRDLLGSAFQGFLMACHKWRPDGGRQFKNYVFSMVKRMIASFLIRDSHRWRNKFHRAKKLSLSLDELGELGLTPQRDSRFHPYREADTAFDAVKELFAEEPQSLFDFLVEELGERDRFIITCYFHHGMTLEEIADMLEITKERVRQLRDRAMNEIRERALLAFKTVLDLYEFEPLPIQKFFVYDVANHNAKQIKLRRNRNKRALTLKRAGG